MQKQIPATTEQISLLTIISKVMESIIASDIKSFLFSNGLISEHQFGFRPGHTTLDMLLLLSQQWMEVLNAGHENRAISLDISRAFDTVWHPALLTKLFLWYPRPSPLLARRRALLSQPMCGPKWSFFIPSSCPGWSSSR